jgi:hypothetical protein
VSKREEIESGNQEVSGLGATAARRLSLRTPRELILQIFSTTWKYTTINKFFQLVVVEIELLPGVDVDGSENAGAHGACAHDTRFRNANADKNASD